MKARYEKLERLGGGGMGVVYRARQITDLWEREVALKYMKLPRDGDAEHDHWAFENEAKLVARLEHKNIVRLLDSGEDDAGPFLVFDLVTGAFQDDGPDLKTILKRRGALPVELAAFVAHEVLRGLAYAHGSTTSDGGSAPIVHRDISPDNILVNHHGAVKVTDFGIARMYDAPVVTKSNVLMGKLAYASPERLRFESIDGRSDVFAVGIVLHEMLTGRRLFGVADGRALSERQTAIQVLGGPIVEPQRLRDDVPAALAGACLAMLERDVNRRVDAAAAASALVATGLLQNVGDHDLQAWLLADDVTKRVAIAPATANMRPDAQAMRSATQQVSESWVVDAKRDKPGPRAWMVAFGLLAISVLAAGGAWWSKQSGFDASNAKANVVAVPAAFDAGVRPVDAAAITRVMAEAETHPRDGGANDAGAPQTSKTARARRPRRVLKGTTRRRASSPTVRATEVSRAARDAGASAPPMPNKDALFPAGYVPMADRVDAGRRMPNKDALFPVGYVPMADRIDAGVKNEEKRK